MLIHVSQSGRDIHLTLTDNYKREFYAEFVVIVRDSRIVCYEFKNIKLLPVAFQQVSRFVCGFFLINLKNLVGKDIDYSLNDFELN